MITVSKLPARMCHGWQNKSTSSPLGADACWRELGSVLALHCSLLAEGFWAMMFLNKLSRVINSLPVLEAEDLMNSFLLHGDLVEEETAKRFSLAVGRKRTGSCALLGLWGTYCSQEKEYFLENNSPLFYLTLLQLLWRWEEPFHCSLAKVSASLCLLLCRSW